ncbi:MAG TPA: hypothetical protein DCY00_07275 [Actinobacteria bacterium]|nr:hypothetical protein [Actinomycetota bacterium]
MDDLFLTLFINYIAPILGSLIMILISWGIKKFADKMNVAIDQEKMSIIEETARVFILAAEEKAANLIKQAGMGIGAKAPKIDKMAEVVDGLVSKFPKLSKEEAEKIANSVLVGIPGIGITQL